MKTTPWTIKGAFGLIGEIFDELPHAYRAWKACGCGESAYKCEVEQLERAYM